MRKNFNKKPEAHETPEVEAEASVAVVDEAVETAQEEPKANIVSRAVYQAFYGASYGVVFSSLLVAKLVIPKNSLIDNAIHDGASAARKAVKVELAAAAEAAEESAVFEEAAPVAA